MAIDFGKFALLIIVFLGLIRFSQKFFKEKQALQFSLLQELMGPPTFKVKLYKSQKILYWAALFFFMLPLANPRLTNQSFLSNVRKIPFPDKGIAIYFLIDHSGSMIEDVEVDRRKIAKIDLVKELTKEFVEGSKKDELSGRPNDMLGFIEFARYPQILVPLTLDHQNFLQKLETVTPVTRDEDDGTAIGYAIFKTVNLIVATRYFADRQKEKNRPAYTIKNQIIVVLTDGLQSPSPLDRNNPYRFMKEEQALNYAQANNVRVYFAGVDPILASPEFKDEMKRVEEGVLATKGAFFLSTGAVSLREIYAQIDKLEKSEIPSLEENQEKGQESLLAECIIIGLVLLIGAVILETSVTKITP